MSLTGVSIFALILIAALVVPALILGFYLAPWFFLIMVGLIVVPFLFLLRSAPAES
jgi:hypothetical protein